MCSLVYRDLEITRLLTTLLFSLVFNRRSTKVCCILVITLVTDVCNLMASDGPRETKSTQTHQQHNVRGDFHHSHPNIRTFLISAQTYSACPTAAHRKTHIYTSTIHSDTPVHFDRSIKSNMDFPAVGVRSMTI